MLPILRLLLVASLAGSLALSVPSGVVSASTERLAEREVFGFLPYWELASADGIDLETLTTLAWFGVEAGPDGHLVRTTDGESAPGWAGWTSEAFAQLRGRARDAGVRVVLTVERFAWDAAGRRHTRQLLADPDARRTLVRELVAAVTEVGADGVNLDLEPLPKALRTEYVRLVRALRRALDAVDPTLQLTVDVTPDVKSFPLRRLVGEDAADAAVLMAYEYRTPASRVAGSVAPLRDPDGLDVRATLKRARAAAPADRLILAMPWYGRAWSTRSDEPGSRTRTADRFLDPTTAFYRVAKPRAVIAGRRWDARQGSAWSAYRSQACETCPVSWRQLWYDDVDSVLVKVGLTRRKGLRGVGIWALGYEGDGSEMWSALRYGLERSPDRLPPTGEAAIAAEDVAGERDGRLLVGETVTLELTASDGTDGSGLAFVRVATRGRRNDDGSLKHGTTFPVTESVAISLPGSTAVDDIFAPGTEAQTDGLPLVSPSPGPMSLPDPVPVTIRVQWRDIAGNWSEPIRLDVAYQPSTGTQGA